LKRRTGKRKGPDLDFEVGEFFKLFENFKNKSLVSGGGGHVTYL